MQIRRRTKCDTAKQLETSQHTFTYNLDGAATKHWTGIYRCHQWKLSVRLLLFHRKFISNENVNISERNIENNHERIIEGELRCRELAQYLEKVGAEKNVWLSEDATTIVPRVNYDAATDQIIGLVLPVDKNTGCPITLSYKATSVVEIIEHLKKDKAKMVYLVMVQPIDENLPPFVLQIFGLDNTFTAKNVINRWKTTTSELANMVLKPRDIHQMVILVFYLLCANNTSTQRARNVSFKIPSISPQNWEIDYWNLDLKWCLTNAKYLWITSNFWSSIVQKNCMA